MFAQPGPLKRRGPVGSAGSEEHQAIGNAWLGRDGTAFLGKTPMMVQVERSSTTGFAEMWRCAKDGQ